VEVDEEERVDEAVPERVDDSAELERPDSARQPRVQPAEVTDDGHDQKVTRYPAGLQTT
jgi:hypothetical protein